MSSFESSHHEVASTPNLQAGGLPTHLNVVNGLRSVLERVPTESIKVGLANIAQELRNLVYKTIRCPGWHRGEQTAGQGVGRGGHWKTDTLPDVGSEKPGVVMRGV